jgi:hypothetical protein
MTGKEMKLRPTDSDSLGADDHPARARMTGLGDIVDDDIARRSGHCREHRLAPF